MAIVWYILSLDLHGIGVTVLTAVTVLSLLLVVTKSLVMELADVVVMWMQAFRRIQAEWRKPITIEQAFEPLPPLNQTGSTHE